jgi:hypothetical protein
MRTMIVAGAVLLMGVAEAQSANILDKAINTPSIEYSIYGPGQTAQVVRDAKVAGGQAFRVEVTAKSAQAWDVGASAPIAKPIAKGDTIMLAVWLRAPKLKPGETTPVPFLGVVGGAPAFAHIAEGHADVGPEWTLYNARGVAPQDFAAGQATVALHLGAAKATLDLGPVFVLDLGPRKP